jgi:glycosyltransferase involved in cell wall biosynthesis
VPFRFHTSAYFTPRSCVFHGLRLLPSRARLRVEGVLLRRYERELDSASVVRWLFPDLLIRLLASVRLPYGVIWLVASTLFDRLVALFIPSSAEVVVAIQGSGLATLRRARRLGARTAVIANTPDPVAELEIVSEEHRRLGLPPRRGELRAVARVAGRIRREFAEADLVLAVSEYARRDLLDHGVAPQKIVTTELGVDLTRFSPRRGTPRASTARVLYVGSIQPRKGVIYLARAVEVLRAEGIDCELDLYGRADPPYARLLEPYVAAGAVRLRGGVSRDELAAVYSSADVFALPTLSDAHPQVVYEAMACGVPVVVTDRCGTPVQDGVNGVVVPHANAEALCDAIRRLLFDPELAGSLADAGRHAAASCSWERFHAEVASALATLGGNVLEPFGRRAPVEEVAA